MASKKRKPKTRCAVCGTVATRHKLSVPMCDSIPCEVFRQETIKEELTGTPKSVEGVEV